MTQAFRYLGLELVRTYLLVTASLLVLFDLIAFLTEAEDVGDARYDLLDAIAVVLWSTPALLVDLAPFVALLATLSAFVNLDARAEITALRAAGVSRAWFIGSAALTALAFVLLVAGVERIARPLHLEASLIRLFETSKSGNPIEGGGFWTRVDRTVVNVTSLADVSRPSGIRIYTFGADGTLATYETAESAAVGANQWQLHRVLRRTFAAAAPVAMERFERLQWAPVWKLDSDIYSVTVASLSIEQLMRRLDAGTGAPPAEATGTSERVELVRRLVLPLSTVAYAVLAAAFALGGAVRGGKAVRMAIGIAAALLLYLAEQLVVNAGILAGLPIALVGLVPSLLVLALARWLAHRAT
jgi:lipopolysaccharide export system permease protein